MLSQKSCPVRVIVQARMSSNRFPGKVLAPLWGEPVICHVINAVKKAVPDLPIVVATSDDSSDDPLALFVRTIGINVFRGPLDDVFERFRQCLNFYPSRWVLRINADSPLIDPRVIQSVVNRQEGDLVTTIFPRTFPRGSNTELIWNSAFLDIDKSKLTSADKEHVTQYYYRNSEKFKIINIESGNPNLANLNMAVDTIDDLKRIDRASGFNFSIPAFEEVKV